MTKEEAKKYLMDISYQIGTMGMEYLSDKDGVKMREAIETLEEESCGVVTTFKDDVLVTISRIGLLKNDTKEVQTVAECLRAVEALPPVTTQTKMRRCKYCKYFEYDSWANVNGIPIIVAHEICSKWGNGCKTQEDGYCFLFEPQESEEV